MTQSQKVPVLSPQIQERWFFVLLKSVFVVFLPTMQRPGSLSVLNQNVKYGMMRRWHSLKFNLNGSGRFPLIIFYPFHWSTWCRISSCVHILRGWLQSCGPSISIILAAVVRGTETMQRRPEAFTLISVILFWSSLVSLLHVQCGDTFCCFVSLSRFQMIDIKLEGSCKTN